MHSDCQNKLQSFYLDFKFESGNKIGARTYRREQNE